MRWIWVLSTLVSLLACGGAADDGTSPARPSILLVTVDTLRADALGCCGNAFANTPRIDRLASEGTLFTDLWAACPLTLPSHATILTGLLPPEHGLRDNDPASPLPPADGRPFPTLAEALRDAGYETGAFISASVLAARTGLDAGFEVYDGPEESGTGRLTFAERTGRLTAEAAADWIRGRKGSYFCWVHLFDPHDPYDPPEPFRTSAPPSSPEAYAAEVRYADHCVGLLLDALEASGKTNSTLVVVTSDHGEGLGEHGEPTHGYLLHETTVRVPLVLRWPGKVGEAVVRRETRSLADLCPTLLGAAGLDADRSLLSEAGDRIAVAETLYGYRHMNWAQQFAARQGRDKLIRGAEAHYYDTEPGPQEIRKDAEPPPALVSAINRYRILAPLAKPSAPPPELPEGFPYAGGFGHSRLVVLPWEENSRLRSPDPEFAADLDAVKGQIGRASFGDVKLELLELEKRDPKNPTVKFWLGRNARQANRHREAADAFLAAFDLGLADAKVLGLCLRELLMIGELTQAGELIRTRVSEVVPDTGLWLMVGSYLILTEDLEGARRCERLAESLARTATEGRQVSQFGHDLDERERHKPRSGNDK